MKNIFLFAVLLCAALNAPCLSAAETKETLEAQTGTLEFTPGSTATLLPDGKASFKGAFTQTMTDKKTGEKQVFNGYFDHQAVKENGQWKFCLVKVTLKE